MRFVVSLLATIGLVALTGLAQPAPPSSLLLKPDDPVFATRAPGRFIVRFSTNKGQMLIDVERRLSPHGVDRFYNLVRHGFYDGARFFRVIKPRFAQFGIPADPAVAQAWRTRTIPDDPRIGSNVRGAISYAFAEPNGRTTQIYINLQDNAEAFDKEPFVPFAHVMDGMDVADMLNGEYGESSGGGIRAGKQDPLFTDGNAFLEREFPRLDYITRATVQ
jgi:cyclophilin family peptidyl-prolyl cis-trans isomerase